MAQKRTIDIGDVAKQSGLPASTLRYYEEKGLIKSVGRQGLRRVFEANVLERLAFIALGTSAGFSLEEVGEMFTTGGKPKVDRNQLKEKADTLDREIKKLKAIRDSLRHAVDCPASNHLECKSFQRLMRVAAHHRAKVKSHNP